MNTSNCRAGGDRRSVDDEVADLAVEYVDGSPISVTSRDGVWIIFDHGKLARSNLERAGSLERRKTYRIADHLGVVVVDDWSGDEVGASREVDDGWRGSG